MIRCDDDNKNEIEIVNNVAFVSLCNKSSKVIDKALIDIEDIERVKGFKWCRKHGSGKLDLYYAFNFDVGRMHHFIMNSRQEFDHINNNGLDNRKENLRPCTQSENCRNSRRSSRNTSGAKGVSWDKSYVRYEAYIWVVDRKISLGFYEDVIEAAEAYNNAAISEFGVFANINNIEELKVKLSTGEIKDRKSEIEAHKLYIESRKSDIRSGVKGVTWSKQHRKWQAKLEFQRKPYHLGFYNDVEGAAIARKLAEDRVAAGLTPK